MLTNFHFAPKTYQLYLGIAWVLSIFVHFFFISKVIKILFPFGIFFFCVTFEVQGASQMLKLVYFPSNTKSKGKLCRAALEEEHFIDGGKFVIFPYRFLV